MCIFFICIATHSGKSDGKKIDYATICGIIKA
jgi:hypothetical protein